MNRHERKKTEKLNKKNNASNGLFGAEENLLRSALTLHQSGKIAEAKARYEQILADNPFQPDALHYLGVIYLQIQEYNPAVECILQSLLLHPNNAEACLNLATSYMRLDNPIEAEKYYHQSINIRPHFDAFFNLGVLYKEQYLLDNAITVFEAALEINPKSVEALSSFAIVYTEKGNLTLAEETIKKSIHFGPQLGNNYTILGNIKKDQGLTAEAIPYYKKAFLLQGDNMLAHANYISVMHYDTSIAPTEIYQESCAWAQRYTDHIAWRKHQNDIDATRRLRIGYVSADLRKHAVTNYLEPVLRSHDKSQVEIYCYANQPKDDEITARLKSYADHWRNILWLSDDAAADLIQQDKIDFLIDLSGFTAGNRLQLFARKPAPIQATWIGYFDTTGMKAMDYIITDRFLLPPEDEHLYAEKPLRLPHCGAVFKTHDLPIEVNTLPALKNRHITFGCFNALSKLTQEVIELWSLVLKELPSAKLYLKNLSFEDAKIREDYTARFSALGIDAARIRFSGFSPTSDYLKSYNNVDLGLDPFPYNGATTTLDSLWMGVPVIALKGDRLVGHIGESLLGAVGLEECIANTKEEYIKKAVGLAKNMERLAEIRASLRHTLTTAPLTNPVLFTQGLETVLREAWKKWCNNDA